MKKTLLVSSLLLAPALIYTQAVQAEETSSTQDSSKTAYHSAVQTARAEGLILIQDQPQALSSYTAINQAYLQQAKELQDASNQYALEKEKYTTDLANYEAALNEIEKYRQAEENHKKEQEAAQNQYQQELANYEKEQNQYQKELDTYQKQEQANSQLKANYQKELEQFEKDLADYHTKEEHYQKEKSEQEQAQKVFQEKQTQYEKELELYQEAEKAYQAALKKAQEDSQKEGFLSQAYAQYLIAKSEPNASVRFEGVDSFIGSSHDFGPGLDGIAGTIAKLPLTNEATLFKGAGSGTPAGSGDGYGLILEKNKPIRVLYSNLSNTSYNGKKITRLDYTYELLSTFAEDGKATAFIYTDPTKTIYVGTHGNNKGQVDFAIRQTMTYYFEDGSPVIFDKDKTALLSFASRNNSFEFGEQEFVQLESNLTFIPITGSSVSGEEDYVAARNSNNSKADGSKFDRSEWDKDGHENEYYGAGVALVTGGEISFTFGIRYNPNDINRSANPSKLRDRSRQWFTVNADIKASGLIQMEKPGNPPVAPNKPSILTKTLEAPTKPIQPTEPTYSTTHKPTAPKKPQSKEIPPLPPLTIKAVTPTIPKVPVVFIREIFYKPLAIPQKRISKRIPIKPTYNQNTKPPKTTSLPTYPSNTKTYPTPVAPPIYTSSAGTYPTPARQYSQGQKISYNPVYYPPTPIYYPYYAPSWTPARPTSPSPSSPTPPNNNPSGNTGKPKKPDNNKPKKSSEEKIREWFGINTGFNAEQTKDVLDYIKKTGKIAKIQNPNDRASFNRDVAQSLAYDAYKDNNLQKFFNIYLSQPLVQNGSGRSHITDTNKPTSNYPLDLPHMLTTLASLEKQNGIFDYTAFIKRLAVQPLVNPFTNPLTFLWSAFNNGDSVKRNILLQQNSLVGDLFTNTSVKDYLSDMDAIILARHPKYKDLPLDERLIKYYGQDLTTKRHQLLYEVYGADKTTAKINLASEILLSSLTLGGLGLGLYGIVTKRGFKHIGENFGQLDEVVFEGSFNRAFKNPLQAAKKLTQHTLKGAGNFLQKNVFKPLQNTAKSIRSTVSTSITKVKKAYQTKIGKPALSIAKKAGKLIAQKTAPLVKTMKQVSNIIQNKFIKPIQHAATRRTIKSTPTVAKPTNKVMTPVQRIITKPIVRVTKTVAKPIVRAIARAVPKPITRAVAKVAQIFRPKPSAKKGKKRR